MRMTSFGCTCILKNSVWLTYEYSRSPWPVPSFGAGTDARATGDVIGDVDDGADVRRPAGAFRVGIGRLGERECGDFRVCLPPTRDLITLAGAEHISGLIPTGGRARDDVDAVDGCHGQQAFADAIADLDCVSSPRASGHPIFAAVKMRAQHRSPVPLDDGDFRRATPHLRLPRFLHP